MVELVKLLNCGFGTLGNAIEFDVAVIKDIAPTITIETSTGQKETIDANHLSTSDLGDYTVYHYPKNILDGTVTFTKEDLVLIRVELPEEAVQNYFALHGITECTSKYTTSLLPVYDLATLRLEALKYLDELNCCQCNLPLNFVNKVLLIDAIEYSFKANKIDIGIKLWNKFMGLGEHKVKGCGCNGH